MRCAQPRRLQASMAAKCSSTSAPYSSHAILPRKKLHERLASRSTRSAAPTPSRGGQNATSQPASGTPGMSASWASWQSAAAADAPCSRSPTSVRPVSGWAEIEPSTVLTGAPQALRPRQYQCFEEDPEPRVSLVRASGTLNMTQLWSVPEPARPARQTEHSALAAVPLPPAAPIASSAPREPVTTRIVDRGALSGRSFCTASQLSSFSCRIHLPPCITFFSTWMPIPPSSFTSFAIKVTGLSMTGVTGIFFSRQLDMNFHLSSRSKSLL
mmetsp:Transcript_58757/g.157043  ORF Transcript_58757/g.157043 Transcript_58757/m.157043 type:complete len:270 (-) Transcript_58757:41-850(-)